MDKALASSVSGRLDLQIQKVLSTILTLSLPEILANAAGQRFFLNELSAITLFLLIGSTLGATISAWVLGGAKSWFYFHGFTSGLTMLLWPLMLDVESVAPESFKPWIWWTIGLGTLSIGLIGSKLISGFVLVSYSIGWLVLHSSAAGGGASLSLAMQDSAYLFLFGGSVIGLVTLVRDGAIKADIANTELIRSAIRQAEIDAVERERQRLDALIHDKVLNTLLLASKASNQQEQLKVAELAQQAIESLQQAAEDPRSNPPVTPIGLFRALRAAAMQLLPSIQVRTSSGGTAAIPALPAQALTEATLQAIENARSHSGASVVELKLDSPSEGQIEIKLRDDGIGFRLDRISRDRVGLRTSVIQRMETVGGEAEIASAPGSGTTVILRWPR